MANNALEQPGCASRSAPTLDSWAEAPVLPIRNVSRVVVLDASGAVLLCRYSEAGHPYWVPPGGALDQGETHLETALRELREETGLAAQLEPLLGERRFVLHLSSGPVDQVERYFLARLPIARPPVANSSAEHVEELRWWTLAELEATHDRLYPEDLVDRLRALFPSSLTRRRGNPTP